MYLIILFYLPAFQIDISFHELLGKINRNLVTRLMSFIFEFMFNSEFKT